LALKANSFALIEMITGRKTAPGNQKEQAQNQRDEQNRLLHMRPKSQSYKMQVLHS